MITRIHHATAKRAEANGVVFTVEGRDYVASISQPKLQARAPEAKVALDAVLALRMIKTEYPALNVAQDAANGEFVVVFRDRVVARSDNHEQLLSDALETLLADGVTEEQLTTDPDERPIASVVPPTYKQRYREAGTPNHCGDWLDEILTMYTTDEEGKLNRAALTAIAEQNGLQCDKYAHLNPGLFRMTVRNALVRHIVANGGELVLPAGVAGPKARVYAADRAWLESRTPKPREEKQERKAKAKRKKTA